MHRVRQASFAVLSCLAIVVAAACAPTRSSPPMETPPSPVENAPAGEANGSEYLSVDLSVRGTLNGKKICHGGHRAIEGYVKNTHSSLSLRGYLVIGHQRGFATYKPVGPLSPGAQQYFQVCRGMVMGKIANLGENPSLPAKRWRLY